MPSSRLREPNTTYPNRIRPLFTMSNNRTSSRTQSPKAKARKRRNAKDSPLTKTIKLFSIPGYGLGGNTGTNRTKGRPAAAHFCAYQTKNGGAGRDRTDDLKLAKLPLSQLSYGPFLCRSGAARLAQTCAARGRACGDYRRRCQSLSISRPGSAGDAKGIERPPRPSARKPRRRTSPPAFEASIKWWAWDDSNVRPHPYQGCALTT